MIWAAVILGVLIIDLIIKHFIVGINQEAISGFFSFVYTENTGAAWSIFAGSTWALILISTIAIVLISVYCLFSKSTNKFFHISLALIVGGALGNLFDRIVFGYVRDFIKLDFMNFPIFNIADCALTIGVICLIIYYIIELVKESKKKETKWKK